MDHVLIRVLLGSVLMLSLAACQGGPTEPLSCSSDDDCPPACTCTPDILHCERSFVPCAGTCDSETRCPEGTTCQFEGPVGANPEIYSCLPASGTGGSGGTAGSGGSGGSGGMRGVLERCQESTTVYCNNGYDCHPDGWDVSNETFEDLYGPSLQECLNTESCPTTEEEECDEGGTYNAANHEACISGQKTANCETEDIGGLISPVFPAECDEICIQ